MNNCANSYPPRFSCLAGGMLVGFYSDCKVGPRLAPAALTPLSSPPSPQVVQTCRRSLMMFGMEITIQYFKFWPSDSEFIRIFVEGAFRSPSIVLSIPNIAKHLLHVCLIWDLAVRSSIVKLLPSSMHGAEFVQLRQWMWELPGSILNVLFDYNFYLANSQIAPGKPLLKGPLCNLVRMMKRKTRKAQ